MLLKIKFNGFNAKSEKGKDLPIATAYYYDSANNAHDLALWVNNKYGQEMKNGKPDDSQFNLTINPRNEATTTGTPEAAKNALAALNGMFGETEAPAKAAFVQAPSTKVEADPEDDIPF